jgi:thiol-disulfide isomerase/thioredoxin
VNLWFLKLIGVIIAALVVVAAAGCGPHHPTRNPVKSVTPAEFDKIISHETFSGLVAVVASWCPPCRQELPQLAELDRRYRDQGIRIVALSIDVDGVKAVQPLIDKSKVDFPVYWVGSKGIAHFKIIGVPTLMIVRNGRLVEKRPGGQSRSSLERHIKSLIREMVRKEGSEAVDP